MKKLLLIGLILLLAALYGLYRSLQAYPAAEDRLSVTYGPPPTFVMPDTWTPAPCPTPLPTPTRPKTHVEILQVSATPQASLTPVWGRPVVVGETVKHRPIWMYRFGSGEHERLIIAGIHGAEEYNTITLAQQMIETLRSCPDMLPADVSLYILPALNADSASHGPQEKERLNANGVDLNRNFPVHWKADWRSEGCASQPGTAGEQGGSEPETQAVIRFVLMHKIEALVNYHSAFLGVFPSGSPADPGSVRLARAIAAITPYTYPPRQTGCEYTGTLVDWAASVGVPAAVDVELDSSTESEWEINKKVLELLLHWEAEEP